MPSAQKSVAERPEQFNVFNVYQIQWKGIVKYTLDDTVHLLPIAKHPETVVPGCFASKEERRFASNQREPAGADMICRGTGFLHPAQKYGITLPGKEKYLSLLRASTWTALPFQRGSKLTSWRRGSPPRPWSRAHR